MVAFGGEEGIVTDAHRGKEGVADIVVFVMTRWRRRILEKEKMEVIDWGFLIVSCLLMR